MARSFRAEWMARRGVWASTGGSADRIGRVEPGRAGPLLRPPAPRTDPTDQDELHEVMVINDIPSVVAVSPGDDGYVELAIYNAGFASHLKAVRLAQARRSSDWAALWLELEEEYEARCKHASSLLGDGVEDVALHDGHVAELVLTARALIDRGTQLFAWAPWVRHLHVTRYAEVGPSLFGSQLLRGIQSLGLLREGLGDDDVDALVRSPHIDGLRWLDLSYNDLGMRSYERLAACSALVHLEYLGLEGNASESPVDHMGTDPLDGSVVSTTRTPAGRALEERAGELKWLHAPSRYPYSYPPSPLDVAKAP